MLKLFMIGIKIKSPALRTSVVRPYMGRSLCKIGMRFI